MLHGTSKWATKIFCKCISSGPTHWGIHLPSAGHSQLPPCKVLPPDDTCHQQATVSWPPERCCPPDDTCHQQATVSYPPWKMLPPDDTCHQQATVSYPPARCCPLMTHAISRPQSVTPLKDAAPWWHMPSAGHSQLTPWKVLPPDDTCHQQATVS